MKTEIWTLKFALLLLNILFLFHCCESQTKHSCYSPIYCQGDLLHTVQMSRIFNDSKTFVDMALLNPVNETLSDFYQMMAETNHKPSKEHIKEFVHQHFVSIGELEDFHPREFKDEPKLVKEISERVVRAFAKNIVALWPLLTRKVSYHVHEEPDMHSLIPVDNAFIIPGGRFREYYYWDSYWIIKGLLLSEMYETARGIILNLLSMVERYGFVPNGGRIYYLNRSQPPLLTMMLADYVKWTKDFEFAREHMKTLEKEMTFWLTKRTTTVVKDARNYVVAHYDTESDTPRPESYVEDIETCSRKSEGDRYECYADLKSGSESGLDYTARWFYDKRGNPTGNIHHIDTRRTIPVDLNAYLYKAFMSIHQLYIILREPDDAQHWGSIAAKWLHSIKKVLYSEEEGVWFDYDSKLRKPRKYFFASNLVPLWAEAYEENERQDRGKSAVDYLTKNGILQLKGGIPSSNFPTGQQWDFPNAWAPFQSLIIIGLHKTGHPDAIKTARELAYKWINSNIKAFHDSKVMFEKYDAVVSGQYGGGGEYTIQWGYGWSNGVALELINFYFRAKTRKWIS